jgi:hypothetical protein
MLPSLAHAVTFGPLPSPAVSGPVRTPEPSPRNSGDSTGDSAHRKPMRLSLACNTCRRRKVRCDAGLPKCGNCTLRNEVCETTDLRKPAKGSATRTRTVPDRRGREGYHGRTGSEPAPVVHPAEGQTGQNVSPTSVDQSQSTASRTPAVLREEVGHQTPGLYWSNTSDSAPSPRVRHGTTGNAGPISWVSRGYRETHNTATLPEDASTATPDTVINTDDTPYRVKVGP